jgi:hypothetical protein
MTRAWRAAGLAAIVAVLAVIGWRLMATTFMIHDDEGYVLISLRNFSEHGRLYDGVFTQYGPVPFLYYDVLHRLLDLPVGSLLGRLAATAHWLSAALAAGLLAWRLTQRYWTAAVTLVTTFGYLWQMTWEPVHPGGLIAVIIAIALAGTVTAWTAGRVRLALALLGAAGAALVFIKINVGLLWCCAVGAALLLNLDEPWRTRGRWLAAAGLALLPYVLMRPLLGEPWVWKLALTFAATGVTLCLPVETPNAPLRVRDWGVVAGAFLLTGLLVIALTLTHGTSATALWQGVVLDPLRHPVNFHLGFTWLNFTWAALAASVATTALWWQRPAWRDRLRDGVAGLRLLGFAAFLWHWSDWVSIEGLGTLVRLGLPLLPLYVLPLAPDARGATIRQLAALVAAAQVLHTYPVAGSQMAWGSFLLVPLLLQGVVEAAVHAAHRFGWPRLTTVVAALALAGAGAQGWLLADQAGQRWRAAEPLNIAGVEFLRPQENVRYALRIVTANARLHADVLFSRPGMFGFNLWTGVPTPTLRNATHWFWLLSPAEQQAIIDRLDRAQRPVVISSRPLLDLLRNEIGVTVAGPLHEYINQHYRPLFTVTGYEFLVPKASPAVPFFVAQNFRAPDAPAMIAVNLATETAAEVVQIVLRDVRQPAQPLASWDRRNSQVTLQTIDAQGRPAGAAAIAPWPLRFAGQQQLRLYHRSSLPADRPELELVFLDAQGHAVFEACYDLDATVSLPPTGG